MPDPNDDQPAQEAMTLADWATNEGIPSSWYDNERGRVAAQIANRLYDALDEANALAHWVPGDGERREAEEA